MMGVMKAAKILIRQQLNKSDGGGDNVIQSTRLERSKMDCFVQGRK